MLSIEERKCLGLKTNALAKNKIRSKILVLILTLTPLVMFSLIIL